MCHLTRGVSLTASISNVPSFDPSEEGGSAIAILSPLSILSTSSAALPNKLTLTCPPLARFRGSGSASRKVSFFAEVEYGHFIVTMPLRNVCEVMESAERVERSMGVGLSSDDDMMEVKES